MTPGALDQDQPNAHVYEPEARQAVSNEISTSLLVLEATVKELRAHLYDDAQLTYVEFASPAEPNLDVARFGRSCPWFLRAIDGFCNEVWQAFGQTTQVVLADHAVVGDINQGHDDILAVKRARGASEAAAAAQSVPARSDVTTSVLPAVYASRSSAC